MIGKNIEEAFIDFTVFFCLHFGSSEALGKQPGFPQ